MFQRKRTDSVKIFAKLKQNAHYYFKTSGDRSEKKNRLVHICNIEEKLLCNNSALKTKLRFIRSEWMRSWSIEDLTLLNILINFTVFGHLTAQRIQSARLAFESSELGPPRHTKGGETLVVGGRAWGDPIPTKWQTLWYFMYAILPLRLTVSLKMCINLLSIQEAGVA